MKKEENTKEKICAFYASDYHFEMISLPYINKKMEENNDVIILTENDLEETMQTLLSKINLKEEKKEKILKLNWKNNNLEKINKLKEKINEKKNLIIFIKGKESYINYTNRKIGKWIPEKKEVKIVDCYNIEEVGENLEEIVSKYQKILRTAGEIEV